MVSLSDIFLTFLKLGCVAFGGPVAHIGYFRRRFVDELQWLSAERFNELLVICQFLPGPASSQLGMAIGREQQGVAGSIAAFVGFTLPSAILMLAAAMLAPASPAGWLAGMIAGLKLVALVVVTDALIKMVPSAWGNARLAGLGLFSAVVALGFSSLPHYLIIVPAALLGARFFKPTTHLPAAPDVPQYNSWKGLLGVFLFLLLIFPLVFGQAGLGELFSSFYRVGALVFGGGHVVLPLLQSEPLVAERLSSDTFLAGYALAQAVPGPMFSLAAFLGAELSGGIGGLVALIAIFLPGWLLLLATLNQWHRLRQIAWVKGASIGINAAVVGLLLAVVFDPVLVSAITGFWHLLVAALLAWLLLRRQWSTLKTLGLALVLGAFTL